MMQIVYSREALRSLSRMPINVSRLIRSKIEQYAAEPSSQANNVKALKGYAGVYRLRVGDWRIIFTETGKIIAIIKVAARGEAYD